MRRRHREVRDLTDLIDGRAVWTDAQPLTCAQTRHRRFAVMASVTRASNVHSNAICITEAYIISQDMPRHTPNSHTPNSHTPPQAIASNKIQITLQCRVVLTSTVPLYHAQKTLPSLPLKTCSFTPKLELKPFYLHHHICPFVSCRLAKSLSISCRSKL